MSSKATKKSTIEDKYQKMTPHEHILALPDTYIGSISSEQLELWVVNEENKMEKRIITYVPGLYKIYDEILVNARDHSIKEPTCKTIKVNIDQKSGEITVYNDGPGIEVEIHKVHKIYVPELIFGNLLTSSNYKQTGKTWGGKNGYGAKLANIYSKQFKIETVDTKNGKKYCQTFTKNMYQREDPIISNIDKKATSYTKISFIPDYEKFGMDHMTDDILGLFKKRVYDIAACTYKNVKVYLNDDLIQIDSFGEYIKMFYVDNNEKPAQITYSEVNERWKVGVVYIPGSSYGFSHMSHVNGIWTYSQQGGTHVAHAIDQIMKGIMNYIKVNHKGIDVKASYIKENITLFVDCVIEDPSFSSQTKECLTTKATDFVKKCDISDNFILSIAKSGIVDEAVRFAQLKSLSELTKLSGKKTSKIYVEKHDAALWAGTKKSAQCRLIITEGDSAKTFALRGREIIGQERYGVFPIRGKMLNVREAPVRQQQQNEEIRDIIQIMGLKLGMKYDEHNINKLNYGGILILTDQDPDGSHIKGLVMNFIHYYWSSLLKIDGFMQTMSTPLVKIFKKSDKKRTNPLIFYSLVEYTDWKKTQGTNLSKWTCKYYKGLGSSSPKEALECFKDFDKKLLSYIWESDKIRDDKESSDSDSSSDTDKSDDASESDSKSTKSDDLEDVTSKSYYAITHAFAKEYRDYRKQWLNGYDETVVVDPVEQKIPYSEFIDKDLIHFANYNIIRSVPRMIDGLKPSQRKILFQSLQLKLFEESREVKVGELASETAGKTGYLHGEVSLQEAIVGMAQNFTGSNNINILHPSGEFGSRRMGGADHASPRYIHTFLSQLTPLIFKCEDEPIYDVVMEDGKYFEPKTYAPIIPMVLINGAHGIGTGYSTHVPTYNPKEIIKNISKMMNDESPDTMLPWHKGFTGKIVAKSDYTNMSYGCYEILDENTLRITELPIGVWTADYENYIRSLVVGYKPRQVKASRDKKDKEQKMSSMAADEEDQCLTSYVNKSLPDTVDFTLIFQGNSLQQLIKKNKLVSLLKLSTSKAVATSNMYLFDTKGTIKKYDDVSDILEEFYDYRLGMYEKRKIYHTRILKNDLDILKYKIKFLKYVIDNKIIVGKRKKQEIIKDLVSLGFPKLSKDIDAVDPPEDVCDDEDDTQVTKTETHIVYKKYNYITDLQIFSMTDEKLTELSEQYEAKKLEYEKYIATPSKDIWKEELRALESAYDIWYEEEMDELKSSLVKKTRKSKKDSDAKGSAKKSVKKSAKKDDD